jgi:hypothetical protein
MKYTGSEDPVLSKPFTLVDPQGNPWVLATDRVWFVAVKNKNTAPRFKGGGQALAVLLKLIQCEPDSPTEVDPSEVVGRLGDDGLTNILGVVVARKRLRDLFLSCTEKRVQVWDATHVLGLPGLGITMSDWRAYLMGFDNAENVDEFSLVPPNLFDLAMGLD